MSASNATLHMLRGKIAAGKSTISAQLARAERTLLISEDRRIARLYGPELRTIADFFERSDCLRGTLSSHIVDLLRADVSRACTRESPLEATASATPSLTHVTSFFAPPASNEGFNVIRYCDGF